MKRKFIVLLLISFSSVSFASNSHLPPMTKQCRLANAEMNESGKLMLEIQQRWMNDKDKFQNSGIDEVEFMTWRKEKFNQKFASIRDRYSLKNPNDYKLQANAPIRKSNNATLQLHNLVNALQSYSTDKNLELLRETWPEIYKKMMADGAEFDKLCGTKQFS
ncbi:hypothetical protein JEQ07_18785 [Serratia proteamaculans]|uniref:Uncharacterized protein n=1 Tax=Serratia proteamaculans TaxID=28151 RepID=A0ABS0TYR7_SERPR|nr:hypothetical protein [Serratia proteamaculans]MBI6182426.1 hypothetical protein [Serratia proteamaculans]